jgi:hypothetical protein
MLPLDHPGLGPVPVLRPVPVGADLVAGVVVVPVSNLVEEAGPDGTRLLVPKRGGPVRDGELVAWCTVVSVAPAVVDPDGAIAVEGWLPDHARLGVLEEHLADGMVERLTAEHCDAPTQRQRVMSLALTLRLVLALTLLPNASYVEALTQVVGLLPRLPWAQGWHVPASTTITEWRRRLGVAPLRELFRLVAGHIVAVGEAGGAWHGLRVCAIDGTQVRTPDSDANRAAFGSSGTADDSASFPQVRLVAATARAGRAILAAAFDASSVGEQTLAARQLTANPDLFTHVDVVLMDRNFYSSDLIDAIHRRGQGAHLLIRVKDGIRLPVEQRLPDGSYLTRIRVRVAGKPDYRLGVRVVEYDVTLPDGTGVSELFCLVTTLTDHLAYPAADIAELYPKRWSAAETTIGENKSTITDAGPSRGPILRSETPDLVKQELWAWLAATQTVRRAARAAAQTTTGISTDQISFTTMRREATRSMTQTAVTATSTPTDCQAAATRAAHGVLANLLVTGRDRHSPRKRKYQPRFAHTSTTKITKQGSLKVNLNKPLPDTS